MDLPPPAPPTYPSLPLPTNQTRPSPLHWRRTFTVSVWLNFVLAIGVFVVSVMPAPYVEFSPGTAFPTQSAVKAADTKTYESPDGTIYFLTVTLSGASQKTPYSAAFIGWLSGNVDVVPRSLILGGQSGQKNREQAQADMAGSKDVASKLALEHLGFRVPEFGDGAIVVETNAAAPAAKVLKPRDIITAVDEIEINTDEALREAIASHEPGETVMVRFNRGKEIKTSEIELTSDADDPTRARLGVGAGTANLHFNFPVKIDVKTNDVGGPSAGLALTLGILDVLTPGSLTGNKKVAVTGTIDLDGNVGAVGGVPQKAVAATRAGAEAMIVPRAEAKQAQKFVGKNVKIIPVDTLDQALTALSELGGNAKSMAIPK